MSLLERYCPVDDFCRQTELEWQQQRLGDGTVHRERAGELSDSAVLSILIHFLQSQSRSFKAYDTHPVAVYLRAEFPNLVAYARFVQLTPPVFAQRCAYRCSLFGRCTGVSFIASTFIAVCDNRRLPPHQVFAGRATRGRGSCAWS